MCFIGLRNVWTGGHKQTLMISGDLAEGLIGYYVDTAAVGAAAKRVGVRRNMRQGKKRGRFALRFKWGKKEEEEEYHV